MHADHLKYNLRPKERGGGRGIKKKTFKKQIKNLKKKDKIERKFKKRGGRREEQVEKGKVRWKLHSSHQMIPSVFFFDETGGNQMGDLATIH
ncbi:hypothetical protein QQG55_37395 [Brugia pahangi]